MSSYGRYQAHKTIAWGRRATFFSARANGDNGDFLVVIRRARQADRSVSEQFLRAAAEQQTAVGAGCHRFAPILDFAIDETGFAYYATARYETSVSELIESGCTVDSPFLREIVTGILMALTELHEKSRRSHGNLTAGNILFDPNGRVFLTDLAPSAKDVTVADDLFAVGALIYQLVRRTTRIGTLTPPLDYSPEWTESLGEDAGGWLEFTNRLLAKTRNKGPEALKIAATELKSLASLQPSTPPPAVTKGEEPPKRQPPPRKKSALPRIAGLLAVLAVAGVVAFRWKQAEKEKKRRAEEEEVARQKVIETMGPAIIQLRNALKQPLPEEIEEDQQLKSLLGRIGKSLAGGGTKEDVRATLGNWELPDKMKAAAAEWSKPPRTWDRLAEELKAVTRLDLDGERGEIMAQLQDGIRVRKIAVKLDSEWTDTVAFLSDLARAKNPLVPDFTTWAAGEVRSAPRLAEAPARASAVVATLKKTLDFVQTDWKRVNSERFKAGAPDVLRSPSEEQLPGWPQEWMRQAVRYLRPQDEKLKAWVTVADRASKRIIKRPVNEQPAWTAKLQAMRNKVADALDSDTSEIDTMAAELNTLRDPMEEEHEKYVGLLAPWKEKALSAAKKEDAQARLDEFRKMTKDLSPAYRAKAGVQGVIDALAKAIATPDSISLAFAGEANERWKLVRSDTATAIYKFDNDVEIPFIALGKDNKAMAAVETPLILAKLSAAGANAPRDGPQIRTAAFDPAADWLWRGPRDFIQANGIPRYFATGVTSPGDMGQDSCPVTWLDFREASSMAAKLGGSLPTAEQWLSAYPRAGPVRRLRASAWTAQTTLVETWRTMAPGHAGRMPDAGSFSKQTGLAGGTTDYLRDPAAATGATDDKVLWLRSVFPSGSRWQPQDNATVFHHLIGNAAEWVTSSNRPAIIGGSIVSSPKLPTNLPLTPTTPSAAFDVTFRLTVELAEGGAGEGLKKFLEAAGNIKPPASPAVE